MMKDKFDELVETLFSSSLIFSHHINLETFFSFLSRRPPICRRRDLEFFTYSRDL